MNINHVLSVEELRDGGSLIISFQSDDSCEYWLMLTKFSDSGKGVIHGSPVLINRTTSVEVSLDWNAANVWLHKLEAYITNSEQLGIIEKMKSVIGAHT
ncbi:hypothetical protein [Spartinivicinus ruber]|uniref:hypothetical protein n=1 Tax=Spartinivicinus ruber TaxID=2683272 RepID=UPI0013D48826|nr:hypothetical protein [Spartinivicinus ruber]